MVDIRPLDLITDSPWFSGLPEPALQQLAGAASIRPYPRGGQIYTEGEVTTEVYCVVTGRLRVAISSSEGHDFAIVDLRHGFWFGEPVLASDAPRVTSVQALTSADVLVIPRQVVLEVAEAYPLMYRNLFHDHIAATRKLYELLRSMLFYPLRARVALRLLNFAEDYGVAAKGGTCIDIKLTQNDLARLALGSRQRVNKVLRTFTEQGLIETRDDRVVILNSEGLAAEVEPG
ncbi:Crp/Fnr family transcriptional regulator [Pseudohalioglobus sediminis]|uniref:Crp/Fnr family transcriptional regulator n=1 Tax=Pseudohalioglobus sediminis TaxID=2606449 RepID=A0A5B0X735_9GAMM|nr:Crp/Fnr family transcriptional regulator [Pseudohalioglobus sediminis]KAA1194161.1 Crp/Fnr family transcriptional regulator [Pseudohalioglobus sediminis]